MNRLKSTIDETERLFSSACSEIPTADAAAHDQRLKFLLFEFISEIFCAFLEVVRSELGSGGWDLKATGSHDFSLAGGLFLSDIAEEVSLRLQRLAALPENRVTGNAELFAESELVFSVLHSIQVRRKLSQLTSSANANLVGNEVRPATNVKNLQIDIAREAGLGDSKFTRIGDLNQLRKRGSLHQAQAALELGCGPRNIRKMVSEQKLTKTGRGRILVDEKFSNEHRLRYSPK